jgi:mono/diheme cytochrome c family protein
LTLVRCGVVLVAVLALAGCGGSKGNPRRDAVNTYFDKVDNAEAGVISGSGEIDQALRNFRLSGNSPAEVHALTFARDRLATALRRVRALQPPPDARKVHADIVELLTLQHAAALEILQVVTYQPRFAQAIAPLAAAGTALSRDIKQAAKTDTPAPATVTAADKAGAAVWGEGGCGGCHTLAAVGSTGTSGPNLDVLQLTPDQIAAQVRSGGGGMPAFAKKLTPARIQSVAAFVSGAEAHEAANNAVLDAYAAAFNHYRGSLEAILGDLKALRAPPVLQPTLDAELQTLARAARLSGSVGTSLTNRDVTAANAAIRKLFTTAAAAGQGATRQATAAAVRAYNGRLRRIATLSARIVRERQKLVAQVG